MVLALLTAWVLLALPTAVLVGSLGRAALQDEPDDDGADAVGRVGVMTE